MADSHPRRVFTQRTAALADATTTQHEHTFTEKRVVTGVFIRSSGNVTFTLGNEAGNTIIGPDGITPAEWSPTTSPIIPELPGGPLVVEKNDKLRFDIANATGAPQSVTTMVHTVRWAEWERANAGRVGLARALASALPRDAT